MLPVVSRNGRGCGMTTRLLLFGASGFAGSHFRSEARAAGFDVLSAGRRSAPGELSCNLLDPPSLSRALRDAKPSVIVNLAGASSVAESWRDPAGTFAVNAVGTLNLLEASARHASRARLLAISSGEVYGEVDKARLPVTECEAINPATPYAASKAAAEILCGQYRQSKGLKIAVARSFNHIGPGQSHRFAASSFARQIAEAERSGASELMLRVGDLGIVRDFTDVRDTVRAYRLMLERALTGTYNVCSGRPTGLRQIVDLLRERTSTAISMARAEDRERPTEAPVSYGSPKRLATATGWAPRIPVAQSVADLLDWWRERVPR
jgi:GDP-4-dehydro-6-deoxy-D-mannose reductase